MKKTAILLIFSSLLLTVGCFGKEASDSTASETEKNSQKNSPVVKQEDEKKKNDDEPIKVNQTEGSETTTVADDQDDEKPEEQQEITGTEAAEIVRLYLKIKNEENTVVELDHEIENRYVIHVYDVVNKGEETEHTATRGWYYVSKKDGKVESMF